MKFDVEVNSYTWTDDSSDTVLIFEFSLEESASDDEDDEESEENSRGQGGQEEDQVEDEGDRITLGDAYFYAYDEAVDSNDEAISVSFQEDSGRIQVIYQHFSGSLFHDPEFGVDSSGFGLTVSILLGLVGFLL